MISPQAAYEQYRQWCASRGLKPAPFETWKRQTDSISDYNFGFLRGSRSLAEFR